VINCRTLARLLLGYVAKELPAEYDELVCQHLSECPECLALADSYRSVVRLGRQLSDGSAPPALLQALQNTSNATPERASS